MSPPPCPSPAARAAAARRPCRRRSGSGTCTARARAPRAAAAGGARSEGVPPGIDPLGPSPLSVYMHALAVEQLDVAADRRRAHRDVERAAVELERPADGDELVAVAEPVLRARRGRRSAWPPRRRRRPTASRPTSARPAVGRSAARREQRRRRRSRPARRRSARRGRSRSASGRATAPARAAAPPARARARARPRRPARCRPTRARVAASGRVGLGAAGGRGRRDQIAGHDASSRTSISGLRSSASSSSVDDVVAVELACGDQRSATCSVPSLLSADRVVGDDERLAEQAGDEPALVAVAERGRIRVVVHHAAAGAVHDLVPIRSKRSMMRSSSSLAQLGILDPVGRGRSARAPSPRKPTIRAGARWPSGRRRRRRSCSGRRRRARRPSRRAPRSGRRTAPSASARSGPRSPSPGGGRRRSRACGSTAGSRAGSRM